jgi:putative nucleotidyltransferase-like protein
MYFLPLSPDFQRARLALSPCDPSSEPSAMAGLLSRSGPEFTQFLLEFGLAPYWNAAVASEAGCAQVPASCLKGLQEARLAAAARYLAQQDAIHALDRVFESAGIRYAVMKGAAIRERIHADPSIMLANDIDVLVAPADRVAATALLAGAGFKVHLDPANISHEILLHSDSAEIDLHWNILRPGRTRMDVTAELLSRRVRVNGFWTLSDTDSTFLMLIHPVFSKYICSPHMGLARVMGFLLWLTKAQPYWPRVLEMLGRAGLKTAAWAMLGWYLALAPDSLRPFLSEWRDSVRPGLLRAAYLDLWLRHNLPSRLIGYPPAIQFGLTAFLHDHPSDALIAYRGWHRARRNRDHDANAFRGIEGVPA